jgi:hypothetical protein
MVQSSKIKPKYSKPLAKLKGKAFSLKKKPILAIRKVARRVTKQLKLKLKGSRSKKVKKVSQKKYSKNK